MTRQLLFVALIAFLGAGLWGQSDDSLLDGGDDLDALFEDFGDTDSAAQESMPAPAAPAPEPEEKDPLDLSAGFNFLAGYGAGFSGDDWDRADQSAALKMNSAMTLDFRLDESFRVLQKFTLDITDLELDVSEFFCDLTIKDRVYTRFGRQNLSWGTSRYYPFANLTARLPRNFDGETGNYAVKAALPVSAGGIELLAYTREGYVEDMDSPDLDEIGYGGTVNWARPEFDFTLGTYYINKLNWRQFYNLNTTLFRKIEVYHEFVHSYDMQSDDEVTDEDGNFVADDYDARDFSLNLGLYTDLLDGNLQLSVEYFYCGEESELDVIGLAEPLMWGNNLAGGFKWDLAEDKLHLFAQVKYNVNENTGMVTPGVTFDWIPHLSLNLTCPVIFGSSGGYKDYYDSPVTVGLLAIISGRM